jgi:hypothetical protein
VVDFNTMSAIKQDAPNEHLLLGEQPVADPLRLNSHLELRNRLEQMHRDSAVREVARRNMRSSKLNTDQRPSVNVTALGQSITNTEAVRLSVDLHSSVNG